MSHNFKCRCARRSKPRPSLILEPIVRIEQPPGERPLGGGSGGGPGDGGHAHYANSIYQIDAEGVEILARSGQPRITILATTETGGGESSSGALPFVNVHSDKAVRITTGTTTDTLSLDADGLQIITEKNQEISLVRGLASSNPQHILIDTNGIDIDANLANLVISSVRSITLQVAGGTSSIELTPEGITLTGLEININ
jgi:hypothetical protein